MSHVHGRRHNCGILPQILLLYILSAGGATWYMPLAGKLVQLAGLPAVNMHGVVSWLGAKLSS